MKDALSPLVWDGPASHFTDGGYARMISLSDGSAAVAYGAGNRILLKKSGDGENWSEPITVTPPFYSEDGTPLACANANVYEWKPGALMAAYRVHSAGDYLTFYSSIRFSLSSDGGATWSEPKTVAENTYPGKKFSGFWEPHMILLPDGRLALYYASDCLGGTAEDYPFVSSMLYQHIILHLFDERSQTFGGPLVASDGEKHNSRDGMPVVTTLADGSLSMVIESSHDRENHPFVIRMLFSRDGIVWSEPRTVFSPAGKGEYAGAPYIITLPDGRVAVSFQGTENSGCTRAKRNVHKSTMNVLISRRPLGFADAESVSPEDFSAAEPPFRSPERYAIWPAMAFSRGKLHCLAQCGGTAPDGAVLPSDGLFLRSGTLKF